MSWMALRMKWHNQCLRWEAGGQGRQCDGFTNSLVPLFWRGRTHKTNSKKQRALISIDF